MLEIVQFADNNRYGLRNTLTGIVIDREWRTVWGAYRALRRRNRDLAKALNRLNTRKV